MALCTMGPRQMMASSSFCWKKPMDTTFTPKRSEGTSLPFTWEGGSVIPKTLVTLGQSISTSSRPTELPLLGKGDGQVYGHGGLAHAPLAAIHGHLGLDFREILGDGAALLPSLPDGVQPGLFLGRREPLRRDHFMSCTGPLM